MKRTQATLIFYLLLAAFVSSGAATTEGTSSSSSLPRTNSFINFETAPVHPVAFSPAGRTLAVCNLPDGRVEIFSVGEGGVLEARGSVPVGIDPVSARFRTEHELWVVNHISDTINVIDVRLMAVTGLVTTRDGPADVVFAGSSKVAFVSCPPANVVQVIDPDTRLTLRTIEIEAERPKALAVSADGSKVYAAILESGNGTTILAPRFTGLGHVPPAGPADLDFGPHGGVNPAPNSGTDFLPAFGTNFPSSNLPPRVSLIVKKQADGRWMDDNNGDWTSFISGTNAPFSGRVKGWDLVDRDIAVIDANNFQVSFIERLMNICLDLAVNPVSGEIALVGTDALNHVRFEPVLRRVFTKAFLALVQPTASGNRVVDLNPHLDYSRRTLPVEERRKSLGDPRGVLWNASGTKLYVTGMGSDNVAMFDAAGNRLAVKQLAAGPTGLALDASGRRLFVLCRFDSTLTTLDAETLEVLSTQAMHDPTPIEIKRGRPHFYNSHKTSGLGQAACASCHVDGRMDRLAWDLGSQLAAMKMITATNRNFGGVPPASTNHFHPMKGPMVTQTLQDIIGHEPFHWRGDRDGLEEFNPTFTELQGADEELSEEEMQEFEDFLATIHFPPNPHRNFDNTLPRNLRLDGHLALGRGALEKDSQLPNGDAVAGLNFFRSPVSTCTQCHTTPSGMGPNQVFRSNRWMPIAFGPKGERHLALSATERSHGLPFKIPQLRNLGEKLGLNYRGESRSGFGFFHDGRVDSLTRFLQDGFNLQNDKQTADVIAFLLSFSGSDLPTNIVVFNAAVAPGDFSRDAPAALGRQLLLAGDSALLDAFIARANSPTGRVQLVAKGNLEGVMRGWLFEANRFRPDDGGERLTRSNLLAMASTENKFLFTLVPRGSGYRLGIDRDEDGELDFHESEGASRWELAIEGRGGAGVEGSLELLVRTKPFERFRIQYAEKLEDANWSVLEGSEGTGASTAATNSVQVVPSQGQRFYRVEFLH